VRVFSGSTMPSVGLRLRCAMPVFARFETRSKMAVPVVSEPVPAVVGIAMRGNSFEGMGFPLPSGALTKSRKSASARCQHSCLRIMREREAYPETSYTGSSTWPCQSHYRPPQPETHPACNFSKNHSPP
jgi:hypothetical protein